MFKIASLLMMMGTACFSYRDVFSGENLTHPEKLKTTFLSELEKFSPDEKDAQIIDLDPRMKPILFAEKIRIDAVTLNLFQGKIIPIDTEGFRNNNHERRAIVFLVESLSGKLTPDQIEKIGEDADSKCPKEHLHRLKTILGVCENTFKKIPTNDGETLNYLQKEYEIINLNFSDPEIKSLDSAVLVFLAKDKRHLIPHISISSEDRSDPVVLYFLSTGPTKVSLKLFESKDFLDIIPQLSCGTNDLNVAFTSDEDCKGNDFLKIKSPYITRIRVVGGSYTGPLGKCLEAGVFPNVFSDQIIVEEDEEKTKDLRAKKTTVA